MNLTVKKSLTTVIFCCLLQFMYAQQAVEMTLDKAVEYALANSNEIKIAHLNIEDAEQRILETRATGLPQINAAANLNNFFKVPVSVLPEAFVASARDEEGNLPEGFSRQVSFVLKNQFDAALNFRFFYRIKGGRLVSNFSAR